MENKKGEIARKVTWSILTVIAAGILFFVGYNVRGYQDSQNTLPTTSSPTPTQTAATQPYHLVYEEHVIKYDDSDMQWNAQNLQYKIQQIPYDLNGDGIINASDVEVYIENALLPTSDYQVTNGQTVIIPYGSLSNPLYPKGAIVKIVYGVANQ